jgi:hypothetical protein
MITKVYFLLSDIYFINELRCAEVSDVTGRKVLFVNSLNRLGFQSLVHCIGSRATP